MPKPPNALQHIEHRLLIPGLILIVLGASVWIVDPPRAGQSPLFLAIGLSMTIWAFAQRQRQVQHLDLRRLSLVGVLLMVVSSVVYGLNLHTKEAYVALPFALGVSLTVAAIMAFVRGDY